jgi:hypothetical protein
VDYKNIEVFRAEKRKNQLKNNLQTQNESWTDLS